MTIYSQRDPNWSGIRLGTSTTTTIGSHGCTITCLGMLANLAPDVVNRRMIAAQAYAQTNLVIWSKIKDAIPGLETEWRGTTYDNNAVKYAITKYGGCLVEVNGAPIGGSRHWVLYKGNQRLWDPWDGREKSTVVYSAVGFAVIAVKQEVDKRQSILDEIDKTYHGGTSIDSKCSQTKFLAGQL